MELRDRVGQNIQELRRARGISQEELALRAGINRGYMGKVENSKYSVSLDKLGQISDALGVDPSELLKKRNRNSSQPSRTPQKSSSTKLDTPNPSQSNKLTNGGETP